MMRDWKNAKCSATSWAHDEIERTSRRSRRLVVFVSCKLPPESKTNEIVYQCRRCEYDTRQCMNLRWSYYENRRIQPHWYSLSSTIFQEHGHRITHFTGELTQIKVLWLTILLPEFSRNFRSNASYVTRMMLRNRNYRESARFCEDEWSSTSKSKAVRNVITAILAKFSNYWLYETQIVQQIKNYHEWAIVLKWDKLETTVGERWWIMNNVTACWLLIRLAFSHVDIMSA